MSHLNGSEIATERELSSLSPAVLAAARRAGGLVYTIDSDFSDTSAFSDKYGVPLERCANTIVTASGRGEKAKFSLALVPASGRLNTKVIQSKVGGRTSFARPEDAARVTGMEFGAITPLGLDRSIPLFVDSSLGSAEWFVVGAGVRGAKVVLTSASLSALKAVVLPGLAS